MTECRKVQELTKEFLEKLSKVKAFKERIISLKSNNNFENKRIRTKNINNNLTNDDLIINPFSPFSRSDNIQIKNKILKPIKIPPISNSTINQNEITKEKDIPNNIKISKKKLKSLNKPKTSDKSRDKENHKEKFKIKQSN